MYYYSDENEILHETIHENNLELHLHGYPVDEENSSIVLSEAVVEADAYDQEFDIQEDILPEYEEPIEGEQQMEEEETIEEREPIEEEIVTTSGKKNLKKRSKKKVQFELRR